MLGADRPAARRDGRVHDLVDLVLMLEGDGDLCTSAGSHVVVQVAIPEMTKNSRFDPGEAGNEPRVGFLDEGGNCGHRQGNVVFYVAAGLGVRFGYSLANPPQRS